MRICQLGHGPYRPGPFRPQVAKMITYLLAKLATKCSSGHHLYLCRYLWLHNMDGQSPEAKH